MQVFEFPAFNVRLTPPNIPLLKDSPPVPISIEPIAVYRLICYISRIDCAYAVLTRSKALAYPPQEQFEVWSLVVDNRPYRRVLSHKSIV